MMTRDELYAKLVEPIVVLGGLMFLSAYALVKGVSTLSRRGRSARVLARRVKRGDAPPIHA